MSQYQVRQILDNLPSNMNSDDDSDTSFSGDSDLTSVVALIYLAKVCFVSTLVTNKMSVKPKNFLKNFTCIGYIVFLVCCVAKNRHALNRITMKMSG